VYSVLVVNPVVAALPTAGDVVLAAPPGPHEAVLQAIRESHYSTGGGSGGAGGGRISSGTGGGRRSTGTGRGSSSQPPGPHSCGSNLSGSSLLVGSYVLDLPASSA
jgi:hypothetical protein